MNKKNTQLSPYAPNASKYQRDTQNPSNLLSAILGFIVFLGCLAILGLLGAMIISKNPDPNKLIPLVSTISMTVATIIGGLVTAKRSKSGMLLSSLTFLATVTLALLIASIINMKYRDGIPLWQSLLLKLPVILGGIFGAFIGSAKKKPKSLYSKYK